MCSEHSYRNTNFIAERRNSLLLYGWPSFGQDQCVALLRHGIYNTVRNQQSGNSVATLYNQICSSYNSYKSGSLKADASGHYGLFGLSGSYSKDEVEAIGQAMCSSNYSNQEANNEISNFTAVVSPEGLNAFNQCIRDANNGLLVNTDYHEEAPELVTITARYTGLGSPRVTGIQMLEEGNSAALQVTCSGTLVDAARQNRRINNAALTMSCRRPAVNDPNAAFMLLGAKALAYPATVNVSTDAGAISFLWAPIYVPPPPNPQPAAFIGEIRAVAFPSTDPAFKTLTDFGWIECDGRTLNVSDYPELFKVLGNSFGTTNIGATFKIPDLRGVFVRGWNHGAGADPEASSRGPADPSNPHPGWTGAQGDAVGSRQGDALVESCPPNSRSSFGG